MMDFLSDDLRRDPYPLYEQMRSSSPLLHESQSDMWLVFDYESVKRVLTDHETFSSIVTPPTGKAPDWLVFSDPPRHTKLRGIIMRAFTPRSIANLEPRIRELSRELLVPSLERRQMDLASDYSNLLPMMVIAEMIGIPVADRARFLRWGEAIMNLSYAIAGGEEAAKAIKEHGAAKEEMKAYLTEVLPERRRVPKDDLLTRLVEAEVDGEHLTEEEILGFFQLLLSAGTETTTNLINNAILCLIENPAQLALLRAEPHLLHSAIEEVLRYRAARAGAPAWETGARNDRLSEPRPDEVPRPGSVRHHPRSQPAHEPGTMGAAQGVARARSPPLADPLRAKPTCHCAGLTLARLMWQWGDGREVPQVHIAARSARS